MPDRTVINFPASNGSTYTDTAALNDIHAILCRHGGQGTSALDDIAQILARAGRPVIEIRDIEASVTETPLGLPKALVDAGGTKVAVFQHQSGCLAVAITATTADEASLTITLNERRLHPAARRPEEG